MSQNKVALITGANKGIGKEIARGLGKLGYTVLIGSRDLKNGTAVQDEFAKEGIESQAIALDVTNADSVKKAAAWIQEKFGKLDSLVNNAGIALDQVKPSVMDMDLVEKTYQTNVYGPIRMIQTMLPLLEKAPAGRIVNMSSTLGSLTLNADPTWDYDGVNLVAYNSSKSALNAVTIQFAKELRGTKIKVNSACPGYCSTDLNDHKGFRTPAQGAVAAIRLATLPEDGASGSFFNEDGVIAW